MTTPRENNRQKSEKKCNFSKLKGSLLTFCANTLNAALTNSTEVFLAKVLNAIAERPKLTKKRNASQENWYCWIFPAGIQKTLLTNLLIIFGQKYQNSFSWGHKNMELQKLRKKNRIFHKWSYQLIEFCSESSGKTLYSRVRKLFAQSPNLNLK